MRSMDKNVRKTWDLFENLYEADSDFGGIKVFTGYSAIDDYISGLHAGDLVAVVGQAGSGKTSFLLNIALNIAGKSKQKVMFYSLQYTAIQLVFRMICIKGEASAHEIIRGYITKEDYHTMVSAASKLRKAPLFIQEASVEDIDSMLKKLRLRQEKLQDLKVVIIDSIDMLTETDMVQYSECLRKLKAAAVDMSIPILFSAFIPKKHMNKTPKTTSPQERLQAIEIYADTVMHIRSDSGSLFARYNDIYRQIEGKPDREQMLPYVPEVYMAVKTEIALIKNTYGSKGSVFLTFIPRQFRFESDEMANRNV